MTTSASPIDETCILTEADIISHLRARPLKTKDLIALVKPKLKLNPANKDVFRMVVKKVAIVKSGAHEEDRLLELKDEYK